MGWNETFKDVSWKSFFQLRSLDYVGDEVATARITAWENLQAAIPAEVGSVPLSEVVGQGCLHYVNNFEKFLVDSESMRYTKPPRVMVTHKDWDGVCEGLIRSGICGAMAEADLLHVEGRPLLNGLFGVSKGEMVMGHDVHRLIMNLIPLNNICRNATSLVFVRGTFFDAYRKVADFL